MLAGFPNGPPPNTCLTPYPKHFKNGKIISPQPYEMSPFKITLNPKTYDGVSSINITITTAPQRYFKGIMMTFKRNINEISLPEGKFIMCDINDLKFLDVQNHYNSCLVHSKSNQKSNVVNCQYRPPSINIGPLKMSALFVEDYSSFWTRLEQTVDYSGSQLIQQFENPTINLMSVVNEAGCGSTKSCVFFPNLCMLSNSCSFMVSHKKNGNQVDFEVMGPGSGYIAIGLSHDQIMNDDLVIGCAVDPDQKSVQIQTGYTTMSGGRKSLRYFVGINVTNRKAAVVMKQNGEHNIVCTFSLPKVLPQHVETSYPTNFQEKLNIFLVNGNLYPNTSFMTKHDETPLILVASVTLFSDSVNPNAYFSGLRYPIQVHGSLMTMAFIIFLPLAVMIARHFRHSMNIKLFGKQLWFQLHLAFNILFFVFAFSGYFYIISKVENNWNKVAQVHGGFGTVVMLLASINIVIGVTRPDIGTPKRVYFYWIHYINGNTIRVIAFVTFWLVFLTLNLRTFFKYWMMSVVVIWTGGELIFSVAYGILRCVKGPSIAKETYKVTGKEITEAQTNHVGMWGLLTYLAFIATIAVAFLTGLWVN